MRCPHCAARNAESAEWCTQCYARLRTPDAATPAAATLPARPEADARPSTPVGSPPTEAKADPIPGVSSATGARFRHGEDGIDWRCERCESWNPIEHDRCTVCGHALSGALTSARDGGDREVDETMVVAASVLLPGAGHLLLGRVGPGVLRALLYALWLGGGFLLLRAAAASGQTVLPAVPLLVGALVVLACSVTEAQQTATGNDLTLLTPRVTLWLVVAVVGLLMVSFLAAALAVTG